MLPNKYDIASASQRVDEFIQENIDNPIADIHFPSDWIKHFIFGAGEFECVPYGKPESYRIAEGGNEFTFRIIGAVDDFSLPPFDKHRLSSSKIQYIQQVLSLNSLRATRCTRDVEAIQEIVDTFSRRIPLDADQTWTAVMDNSVRFSNRLLVPTNENQQQIVCPMPFAIDPTGALRTKAESYGLVHTDDNVVEYLRLVDNRYVVTTPAAIRRGDIAEIRFSIGLFATNKNALLAKLILRAVIVIDVEFSRIARRISPIKREIPIGMTLKRKRVIDDGQLDPGKVTKTPRFKLDNDSPGMSSVPSTSSEASLTSSQPEPPVSSSTQASSAVSSPAASPDQNAYSQDVEMTDDVHVPLLPS